MNTGLWMLLIGLVVFIYLIRRAHNLKAFFFGLALLAMGVFGLYHEHRFTSDGVRAKGVVTQRIDETVHHKMNSISTGITHNYKVIYTYQVAGHAYTSPEEIVPKNDWDTLTNHSLVPIKFLSENPSESEVDYPDVDKSVSIWVSFGLIGIGLLLLVGATKNTTSSPTQVNSGRAGSRQKVDYSKATFR